jgi:hypothetical protein
LEIDFFLFRYLIERQNLCGISSAVVVGVQQEEE